MSMCVILAAASTRWPGEWAFPVKELARQNWGLAVRRHFLKLGARLDELC
jgi:hypothetical protein